MFEIFVLGFNVINSLPYLRRHKDEQELNNAASPTQQLPNRKSTERHGSGRRTVNNCSGNGRNSRGGVNYDILFHDILFKK